MLQMRARGFALRDCFPDVLRGLISAEEAEDYPEEAKSKPAKDITPPRNPLDMVARPKPVAIESVEVVLEAEPAQAEVAQPIEFALLVPDKVDPKLVIQRSVHQDLSEWADAYEELADKTARAGQRTPEERLTALEKLRDVNEKTIKRINQVMRIRHTASYTQRRKALGADQ